MLVCQCNGVSDRTVRRVIRDGAISLSEVSRACGAGSCCGGCHSTVEKMIRSESMAARDAGTVPAQPAPQSTA